MSFGANPFGSRPFGDLEQAPASGSSGTVNYTNANDTSSAGGTTTVVGTTSTTNANDTSAASGTTTVLGTSATTNANDTSSASGTTTVTGTVNYTNANDTSAASGTAGATTGTVDYTNANDTSTASGWAGTVSGTVDYTNNDDTSSAEGSIPRTRRGAAKPLRKGYIIRGKKYFLTDDELAIMVALELETIKRSDIKVPTKGRIKPIPAATFQMVKAVAKKMDELAEIGALEDDDEEEELLSMLL